MSDNDENSIDDQSDMCSSEESELEMRPKPQRVRKGKAKRRVTWEDQIDGAEIDCIPSQKETEKVIFENPNLTDGIVERVYLETVDVENVLREEEIEELVMDTALGETEIEDSGINMTEKSVRRVNLIRLNPVKLLKCSINLVDTLCEALIDTGAGVSLIKASKVEELGLEVCKEQPLVIYGLGDTKLFTDGCVIIDIVLLGFKCVPCKFYVVPDKTLDYPIFLGLDFFKVNRIRVNLHKRRLSRIAENGARWDVYLPEPDDLDTPYHVFTSMPCYASQRVKLIDDVANEVPIKWDSINFDVDWFKEREIGSMYYDGEVATDRLLGKIEGYAGILAFENEFNVLVNKVSCEPVCIKEGEVMGTISSLIEIDVKEIQVNNVSIESSESKVSWTSQKLRDDISLGKTLTEDEQDAVYNMLFNRCEVLSLGENDLGMVTIGNHKISLYDNTPIYQRPRRFPEPVADAIEIQCHELQSLDIIKPSKSPWSSPVVPVRKKDGSIRLCIDYRKLNKVTIPDRFPMPNITDSIFGLHGIKFMTSLDLVKGYYQIPLDPNSEELTAFSTSRGHWQFKRLPFGLCNAPATFQRQMLEILRDFPRCHVVVYIDDILIVGTNFEQHLSLVDRVLITLERHGVKINPDKCKWFETSVEFLGHQISCTGIKKLPAYIQKVKDFPKPQTVKELRRFLGLVNFQRKFAPKCGEIGKPLFRKTGGKKTAVIKWDNEMEEAYENLKDLMAEEIELTFPDYSANASPLEIFVDASLFGIGVCLGQKQEGQFKVIAYASTAFDDAQQKYSTIERELAAIRYGVKSFHAFLIGQPFILHTDHQPLVYLHNMRIIDSRLARTLEDLADFNFKIVYTPGTNNEAADALSRLPFQEFMGKSVALDGTLPGGLTLLKEVSGGGDSMFEALFLSYRWIFGSADNVPTRFPKSVPELREKIVNWLLSSPAKYGLTKNKQTDKMLKLMRHPGQLPVQEALTVFADMYEVTVCVHFGGDRPVIYQGPESSSELQVHLQCLAGVHYNPVCETRSYDPKSIMIGLFMDSNLYYAGRLEPDIKSTIEVTKEDTEDDEEDGETLGNPIQLFTCSHEMGGDGVIRVSLEDDSYCAILDSGAQISLVTESLIASNPDLVIDISDEILMKGIAEHSSPILGGVMLQPKLKGIYILENPFPFAVVPDSSISNCMLFGLNLLEELDWDMDFHERAIYVNTVKLFDLNQSSFKGSFNCLLGWDFLNQVDDVDTFNDIDRVITGKTVSLVQESTNNNSGTLTRNIYNIQLLNYIPMDDICHNQENTPQLVALRSYINRKVNKRQIPNDLKEYQPYWKQLTIVNEIIVRKIQKEYIPIVSFELLLNVVLNTHVHMAHIGSFKIVELLRGKVWNPSFRKIIKDVCTTCSVCQMNKPTTKLVLPPTLKVETHAPFELMAVDLVSLPKTFQGYVGLLVIVDHYSKWLSVAPIKNKQANTVVNLLEKQIFPGLLKLPMRLLSDNGPEFNSIEFADLMERMNIHHIRTTAYKPSSNGAVERINRTIIGFLRDLSNHPTDWPHHLSRVIQIYNNTVHSETGSSPANFLLERQHQADDVPIISTEARELWSHGHPQYESFQVGQLVLRKIPRMGRLNIHKLTAKYDGPYEIVKVHENKVSYELYNLTNGTTTKAHHIQLKIWKEPPAYIIKYLERNPLTLKDIDREYDRSITKAPVVLPEGDQDLYACAVPPTCVSKKYPIMKKLKIPRVTMEESVQNNVSATDLPGRAKITISADNEGLPEKHNPEVAECILISGLEQNSRHDVDVGFLGSVRAGYETSAIGTGWKGSITENCYAGSETSSKPLIHDDDFEYDSRERQKGCEQILVKDIVNIDFMDSDLGDWRHQGGKDIECHEDRQMTVRGYSAVERTQIEGKPMVPTTCIVPKPHSRVFSDASEVVSEHPDLMGVDFHTRPFELPFTNDSPTGKVVLPIEPGFWWSVSSIPQTDIDDLLNSKRVIDNQEDLSNVSSILTGIGRIFAESENSQEISLANKDSPVAVVTDMSGRFKSFCNDMDDLVSSFKLILEDSEESEAWVAADTVFRSDSNSVKDNDKDSKLVTSSSQSFLGFDLWNTAKSKEEGECSSAIDGEFGTKGMVASGKTGIPDSRKRALDRLAILRQEVEKLRGSIEEHRRESLARCSRIVRDSMGSREGACGEVNPTSPPFTRSRGRVWDLPNVQPRIIERKRKEETDLM